MKDRDWDAREDRNRSFRALCFGLRRLGLSTVDATRCAAELENAEHPAGPTLHHWAMPGFAWPPVAVLEVP